ncbi:MAG: hypothetical protein O3A25_10685 [Acidobacteria bacterium]|nr:hypothetical protein [Acidobacteriota bacterium]
MTTRWVEGRNEQGSALLVTLLVAVLLAGLAGGLASAIMTEESIEANHRRGLVALYAADSMLARSASDLAGRATWPSALDGSVPSGLRLGATARMLADGSSVDLHRVTDSLQRQLDQERGPGAARWQLYAWGWHGELVTESDLDRQLFVAAWVRGCVVEAVSDESAEWIVVRASAFGPFGSRGAVEAVLARDPDTVRMVAWDIVAWDVAALDSAP